jgi:hypothetical protein
MIVSRCCKKNLFIELDYYACERCSRPCDTVTIAVTEDKEEKHDARNDAEIEKIPCIA